MRKIRECIIDGCMKFDGGGIPITLPCFLQTMAIVLLYDTDYRLRMDVPTVTIGGERFDGKAKTNPTLEDYESVLCLADLSRATAQGVQLMGFMEWFMDQDEPEGSEMVWYDIRNVATKWNEYISLKQEKE